MEIVYGNQTPHKERVHVVLDLYGRCALSYNILNTEISSAVIEFFNRTFEIGPNVRSMVHTDCGVAYCSMII